MSARCADCVEPLVDGNWREDYDGQERCSPCSTRWRSVYKRPCDVCERWLLTLRCKDGVNRCAECLKDWRQPSWYSHA